MDLGDTQSFDDEFMQLSFKVEPCMLAHPHGWKMCPFVHPGEPVKRRHPFTHRGDMCNAVKKGQSCEAGDACPYAHNSHELWLHPSRYKTRLCRSGGACARGICFFAHSQAELRQKGSTKQGVLHPSLQAPASPTLNTSATAAAGAGPLLLMSSVEAGSVVAS
ncbi:hypothetical protein OEZ85_003588 [Tetradesmus obliquus]|uniref:C3H1-type domain-containing protein n=1 Tax=Tetradesmus obliquus TaxID=3088 RepID=A0ABY8UFL1_TETOB|nr:hypothetical protein OEZ85_003588 [Tetradesmus obliquus]